MSNSNKEANQIERLQKEKAALGQQLLEARETLAKISSGQIDALVNTDDALLKVYTEKTSDKVYRILVEKMHEGAVTLNKEGIIVFCNLRFAKMLKLPLEKVLGTNFVDYISDSSKKHFETLFEQGRDGYINENVFMDVCNGKSVSVLISMNTLNVDNNFLLSLILTDMTIRNKNRDELQLKSKELEQINILLNEAIRKLALQNAEMEKRAEELIIAHKELIFQAKEKEKHAQELNAANTDVSELSALLTHKESILAILSHDLRSPLNSMIGMADYLKNNYKEMNPAETQELLDLVYESSKNELSMLDYLVEWARIKYASEAFLPQNINLSEYVDRVFYILHEPAAAKSIRLQKEVKKDINVFADGRMLLSILQNLISNAIKHTGIGGEISIRTQMKDHKIVVEVKDNGAGISKAAQENLFSPQMNFLSQARKANEGAGIGLLLVKGFLEKNGGEIWVQSTEGKGSSFFFSLPVDKNMVMGE